MSRIVLPVLDQVVGGDVGLIADGREGGQPDAALGSALEHRESQRAALRREADVSGWQRARAEGCVQLRRRCRNAQAVRA